jgi:hypothetical protein
MVGCTILKRKVAIRILITPRTIEQEHPKVYEAAVIGHKPPLRVEVGQFIAICPN